MEEVEPVFAENHTSFKLSLPCENGGGKDGEKREWTVPDGMWSELLSGTGKALGVYQEDYKKGCMVISEQQFGKGRPVT